MDIKDIPQDELQDKLKKRKIFHGGCLSCVAQIMHGIDYCKKCRYKRPDWTLEDLSIKYIIIYKDNYI